MSFVYVEQARTAIFPRRDRGERHPSCGAAPFVKRHPRRHLCGRITLPTTSKFPDLIAGAHIDADKYTAMYEASISDPEAF